MQRIQNIAADQRFDLIHYESMMSFISDGFQNYNKQYVTIDNKIVKGWEIVHVSGLQVKVNKNIDSTLINSERTGFEEMVVRESTCDDLPVTLEASDTNYVEVELYESTTGLDNVALWDSTANGNVGEEYIQAVDTVLNTATQRLVNNNVGFSTTNPARLPLAIVTTNSTTVTGITDARDFLFHLDSDWSFGVPRTDKTIYSVKNSFDALTTCIKEMKGTSAWYVDQGISSLDILERLNYQLVDGGNISWNLPAAATGQITAIEMHPTSGLAEGDTVTISDGTTSVIFTFTAIGAGANPISLPTTIESSSTVKTAILSAINGHAFNVTASSGSGDIVNLTNDATGAAGNVAITESISNSETLTPEGMSRGFTGTELEWSANLRIIVPGQSFVYTIPASTLTTMNDDDLVYVTLPAEGVAPSGSLTVNRIDAPSYLINETNTRNYIFAYRSGTKIYFGSGWQSVELEVGETSQLGDGVSQELLAAFGLVNEFDSTPPYTSTYFISSGASFTQTISELDSALNTVYGLVSEEMDFKLLSLTGSIVKIKRGYIKRDSGDVLVTGNITDAASIVDLNIDLASIVATPDNDTMYNLYIDLDQLSAQTLTDNKREVYKVYANAHFKLLKDVPPDEANPLRYIDLGGFKTPVSGTTWVGAEYFTAAVRTHSQLSGSLPYVGVDTNISIVAASASNTILHGLGNRPSVVNVFFWDDSESVRVPLNASSHVLDINDNSVEISSFGLTFNINDYLIVESILYPGSSIGAIEASRHFKSDWIVSSGTTSLAHNLTDKLDIVGVMVLEWNTTTDVIAPINSEDVVTNWNNTTINLSWASKTPSSTLRYRIITGPTALPHARPIQKNIRTTAANTSVSLTDQAIICNGSGTLNVNLPIVSSAEGYKYDIKNITLNNVNINPNGTDRIDGVNAAQVIGIQYQSITLISDGVEWWII